MALTGTGNALGDAMQAAIDAVVDKTDRQAVFRAMGTAIIAHVIANGSSAVAISGLPVTVASVTLVTTGTAASGPGTGTATGTANIV